MYALLVPVSAPFVLLATVLGLSWWEDHVLPATAEPVDAPPESPLAAPDPAPTSELRGVEATLTGGVPRR
ncbi:hypothetical protein [Streptomyces sp. NPDC048643]|uniref:hypothetical protein n=1 Tax=Streptomyces sp. NPDC048643 TaxID=3155637 RepID=UPI00341BC4B1